MHPKMMIALANEAEKGHEQERHNLYLQSLVPGDRSPGSTRVRRARPLAAVIRLRPSVS
jgi:hypothetical protein